MYTRIEIQNRNLPCPIRSWLQLVCTHELKCNRYYIPETAIEKLQLVCTHELKSKTAIEKLMNDNVATHMYTRIEISFNINSGYFIWLQLAYMSFNKQIVLHYLWLQIYITKKMTSDGDDLSIK